MEKRNPGQGSHTRIPISLTIATAYRLEDLNACLRLRLAETSSIAVCECFFAVFLLPTFYVLSAISTRGLAFKDHRGEFSYLTDVIWIGDEGQGAWFSVFLYQY